MSKEAEVASFLKNFKKKMQFWDVLFRDDRGKNAQALVDLELSPLDRKAILKSLETKDYSKITMGAMGSSAIYISFHLAQHKMSYPLK